MEADKAPGTDLTQDAVNPEGTEKTVSTKGTRYHAQVDCYQEDMGDGSGPLGRICYVLEGLGDLCKDYHGFKASVEGGGEGSDQLPPWAGLESKRQEGGSDHGHANI